MTSLAISGRLKGLNVGVFKVRLLDNHSADLRHVSCFLESSLSNSSIAFFYQRLNWILDLENGVEVCDRAKPTQSFF